MAVEQRGRVFGLYRDFPSLRLGVDSLRAMSFTNGDISVLLPESAVSKTLPEDDVEAVPENDSAFIGGALGWLTYVHPERTGIIADALVTLGVSRPQAGLYEAELRRGSLLVSIRSSSTSEFDNATAALLATGAESVLASAQSNPPGRSPGNRRMSRCLRETRLVETMLAS